MANGVVSVGGSDGIGAISPKVQLIASMVGENAAPQSARRTNNSSPRSKLHCDTKGYPCRPYSVCMRENRPSNPALIEPLFDWFFDNSTFWVWEEGGVIEGFSAADPRNGSICALLVHPFYERRGIGRALLPLACDVLN
ncbi:MAG TPA: GNAT family N-acetyltransferase [Xanthobacteraceae bacterium]